MLFRSLDSAVVRTLSLEAQFDVDATHLEDLARALNERIAGKSLAFIREHLPDVMREAELDKHVLMRLFVDSAEPLFTDHARPGGTVHIAGAQHLLDHPEFGSTSRVRGIIELMESEEVIVHLLDSTAPDEQGTVRVVIGSEIDSTLMEDYSLLTTKYRYAGAEAGMNAVGTIGLIGPKRMNYSRMISIMQYFALALSRE